MRKQYAKIVILLLFIMTGGYLFGQDILSDYLVTDSIIRKYKIKQVTENWYYDTLKDAAANTTIEKYTLSGNRTQRVHINYFYHKFIEDYEYNFNTNLIVKTQYYYDWNPLREKRNGDTILKCSVTKYDSRTGYNIKSKAGRGDNFQPRLTFDLLGRLTLRIDTVKFGYNSTYFSYDINGNLLERRQYMALFNGQPGLFSVDSLHYDLDSRLVKETNYYDVRAKDGKEVFDREVITTYQYAPNGLLSRKTNVTLYHSLTNSESKPTVYRYEYEFY